MDNTSDHTDHKSAFDAGKYLTKVKGKDYLEVKWRLLWLRTEHPDASVETELLAHEPGQWALFRAVVRIPNGGDASGHGMARPTPNVPEYLETAETAAIGRALAALGYGTQFTGPTELSTDSPDRPVDSPIARGQAGEAPARNGAERGQAAQSRAQAPSVAITANGNTKPLITGKQYDTIEKMLEVRGLYVMDILTEVLETERGLSDITSTEASRVIKYLQGIPLPNRG